MTGIDIVCGEQKRQVECRLFHATSSILIYQRYGVVSNISNGVKQRDVPTMAIKVLNIEQPNEDEIARFHNEFEILTGNLSNCAVSRVALKKSKLNGLHAMHLEWVNGVTLEEYITRRKMSKRFAGKKDIIEAVRLACMIANALSQIHKCKVIHNDFVSTNIVVECNHQDSSCIVSIKIIGFGSAVLFGENTDKESVIGSSGTQNEPMTPRACTGNKQGSNSIEYDLYSLGVILHKIFTDRNPPMEEEKKPVDQPICEEMALQNETRYKKEKQSADERYSSLMESGLPVSLCHLISSLLEIRGTGECDDSAADVEQNLKQILIDPERFLIENTKDGLDGQLKIPRDRLYDRSTHISALMNAYNRFIESNDANEMVLISGQSGTGKTSLVQKLRDQVVKSGGVFISGKFETRHAANPVNAIVTAFDEYCKVIIDKRTGESLDQLRRAILGALDTDSNALTDLIPSLSRIIGETKTAHLQLTGNEALNRLHYCFRIFVRSVSSPSHPIIFFLDDLQWADVASFDLIQTLLSDIENTSLLFIGCYRDNEISHDHPLSLMNNKLEKTNVRITNIKVGNMDKQSVNELISDSLRLLQKTTYPLANIVYRKTSGNCLYVIQFLTSLCEEGLLRFSLNSRRWEWTISSIESKSVASNVAEFMVGKMRKFSKSVQFALKLAACLGFQCESSILEIWNTTDEPMNVFHCLDIVVGDGLMDKIGTEYKFAHDQIHSASYSLIPKSERESLHLGIGRLILSKAFVSGRDDLISLAVSQMNRGLRLITDHDEKVKLAGLNLKAGKKAFRGSAFLLALTYFKVGTLLLDKRDWEENYELCLEVFNSSVETQHTVAEYDLMLEHVEEIFIHAKSFSDKIRASYVFVRSMGTRGRVAEAIKSGLEVLTHLGEIFPSILDKSVIMHDLVLTESALKDFSEEDMFSKVLSLELMTDDSKVAAMKFLHFLVPYAYMGNRELVPLIVSRMVSISISYGVCQYSAAAFSFYGSVVLIGCMDDVKKGYRFGKLALALVEKFNDNNKDVFVPVAVYSFINAWNEPLQATLEPLLHAHKIGMLTGDIIGAFFGLSTYLAALFQSGGTLKMVSEKMKTACHQMMEYDQVLVVRSTQIFLQVVQNLMGSSDDPVKLSGASMDQEELLKIASEREISQYEWIIHYNSMWLAYWFGNYDLAAELAAKSRHDRAMSSGRFFVCDHVFCDGLISLVLARKRNEQHWRHTGMKAVKKMEAWADNSKWNFLHKLELLYAELFFLDGHMIHAAKAYDKAITLAGSHRFINDQALACERAGIFHQESGNFSASLEYYSMSHKCYMKWGARAKTDHLEACIEELQSLLSQEMNLKL